MSTSLSANLTSCKAGQLEKLLADFLQQNHWQYMGKLLPQGPIVNNTLSEPLQRGKKQTSFDS
jgi:hypothetical protein